MKKTCFAIIFMLIAPPHLSYGFDSLPTAIPNGTTGQVLTARTNDTPYWATPGNIKTGTYSRSTTGTTSITGIGYTSSVVAIFCTGSGSQNNTSSSGFTRGGGLANNLYILQSGSPGWSNHISVISDNTNYWTTAAPSINSDGFDVTPTISGGTPGTIICTYITFP